MSPTFSRIDGVPRVRLDEPDWASVVAATGVPAAALGALTPLTAADDAGAEPTMVAAAALALGSARVRVDVTTVSGDRGVVASLGSDGTTSAIAHRILVLPGGGEPTRLAPGVELSVLDQRHLLIEVMRLVPPDPPLAPDDPGPVVALPHTDALVLTEAVRSGDDAVARQVATEQGWDEVPPVLEALADEVRANVTVALRVEGRETVVLRRWLQTELGWVGLAITDGEAVHTPCTREGLADELLYSLTGAFETALAGAGLDG